jgi:uncharacterized protein (TIGR02679 family)
VSSFPTLSTDGLAPLWRAVHLRLSSGRAVSRVRVGPLDDGQRAALADLLGLDRLPPVHATVSLAVLDELLLASVGAGVRDVVADLVGPVDNRAERRARADAERTELWDWLAGHDVVVGQPVLGDWVSDVRRAGLVGGSVAGTRADLERALLVLANLPAPGTPLPAFADVVLHDPHALDEGTRCAGLVLRALATIYDVEPASDAQERRALWERAGVTADELSSVVLAAGLRLTGDDVGSRILRLSADSGQACALTLGQVRSMKPADAPDVVRVFENPSVLALAVARFGDRCPPVVCTSGWPNCAGVLLLRTLAAAGSMLLYHGDFDGEGLRIAAHLMVRTGAVPWRLGTGDYLAALAATPSGPAVGRVTDAPWDADLAAAMRRHDVAVPEERVAATLLDDVEPTARAVGVAPYRGGRP